MFLPIFYLKNFMFLSLSVRTSDPKDDVTSYHISDIKGRTPLSKFNMEPSLPKSLYSNNHVIFCVCM
ncbi:hypothetical protein M153_4580004504 [Pseudoloma neurophilia]|uniref:Uncharacterized protein n=1 Tax=Pseudoloma neurophilia TaxID=146866 RepID=A0A0R0LXC5_9MICR|nr:hypothetical protein M153_4580004504 [Pseudoloma neurophilia]